MKAPIVVFVYNRPEHTSRLLESLTNCIEIEEHDVIVFSDGPKGEADEVKVKEVRRIIRGKGIGEKSRSIKVFESKENMGLAKSVINGVTFVLEKYDRIIVLEDDLVLADNFIIYMNECLETYDGEERIGAVSGFTYRFAKCLREPEKNYISRTGNSWGWATWKRVWKNVDWRIADYIKFKKDDNLRKEFDKNQNGISKMLDRQMSGEIDSWAVRWDYHFFKHHLYTVYPGKTKVINEGFDGSGVHCERKEKGLNMHFDVNEPYEMTRIKDCADYTKYTAKNGLSYWDNLKNKIKRKIKKTRKEQ